MKSKPKQAFKDIDFLESPSARSVRILSEYEKVKSVLEFNRIIDTITFFGSTHCIERKLAKENLNKAKRNKKNLSAAEMDYQNSKFYEYARKLSFKFTVWAKKFSKKNFRFVTATGGGPGIMEAANRGAFEAGGKTIGFGIRLPEEQNNNKYITNGLSFQFHYFFMRKFFLTYPARATIMFPGGFGTLDELTEILTLKQTNKIEKPMPVVLIGKDYWNTLINFKHLAETRMIKKKDLSLFLITDYIDQAFEFIKCVLLKKCLDRISINI